MSSIAIQSNVTQWHWLRDARFDLSFIVGIFTVSVAAGLFVTRYQDWFWAVLIFDLWFLGYHHEQLARQAEFRRRAGRSIR